jgi:hypothetical protein
LPLSIHDFTAIIIAVISTAILPRLLLHISRDFTASFVGYFLHSSCKVCRIVVGNFSAN